TSSPMAIAGNVRPHLGGITARRGVRARLGGVRHARHAFGLRGQGRSGRFRYTPPPSFRPPSGVLRGPFLHHHRHRLRERPPPPGPRVREGLGGRHRAPPPPEG